MGYSNSIRNGKNLLFHIHLTSMKKHLYQLTLSIHISILFLGVLLSTNTVVAQTSDTTRPGSAVRQDEQTPSGETLSPVLPGDEEVVTPFKPYVPDMSIPRVWNPLSRLWEPAVLPDQTALTNTASNCTNSDFIQGNFNLWKGCYGTWCDSASASTTRCNNPYIWFKPPCNNANMP